MNRIIMLLKFSDVMAVRRAVFAAGAHRMTVTPLPSHECAEHRDWYFGSQPPWADAPVRMEVGVEGDYANEIVSVFIATACAGKIERITKYATNKL
jgi:hypothetical protein